MVCASAILAFAAGIVAVACVVVCARQLRRLRPGVSGNPRAVLQALQGDPRIWVESAAQAAGVSEQDRAIRLVTAVLRAPHRRAAIAELNEGLLAVEQQTAGMGHVPQAAARIALAAGGSCALFGLVQGMGSSVGFDTWPLVAAGSGICGGMVCLQLSRAAVRLARRIRADYSRLAQRLRGTVGEEVGADGERKETSARTVGSDAGSRAAARLL